MPVFLLPNSIPVDAETSRILSLPVATGSIYAALQARLRYLPPQRNITLRPGAVLPVNLQDHEHLALLAQIVGQEEMDECGMCSEEDGIFESCVTVWVAHELSLLCVSCANCYFERPDLNCSL